jgi:hypothetical protein
MLQAELSKNLKGKCSLEDLGIDGRMVLRQRRK